MSANIMVTDTHCHLASHRFEVDEVEGIIKRATAAGVHRMVTLATSLEDISRNLEIAKTEGISAALGIHPCDVHHVPDDALAMIAEHLGDRRVCAIGETGLDYFHPAPQGWSEESFRSRQQWMLREHFLLAQQHGLNIVIHTRDREGCNSLDDALGIYRDFSESVRAVFHCFVSPWEQAEKVISLGGLVSFGGVATFKNSKVIQETVRRCPAGSFMLETDSPYLSPEPFRGKRNEPGNVSCVAGFIAELRGESIEELARHTEETADYFFRWKIDSAKESL